MKKAFKITFALASVTLLVGCNLEVNPTGAALMTAINYEGDSRIVYNMDDDYSTPTYHDPVTGKDYGGKSLAKGDYKPVFTALQNRLSINMLEHQAAANSGDKKSVAYFRDNWMTKTYADMSMGTVYDINNYSVAGNSETILDLKPYIDQTEFDEETYEITKHGPLDNIATFLHDNPGVKMSIITAKHSHPDQGAIYYVPYCDGFNDLEKAPIMRADYVERLLDDDPDKQDPNYQFSSNKTILGVQGRARYTQHFEPCYEDEAGIAPSYTVSIPNVDEDGKDINPEIPTIEFKKNKTNNIISLQNSLITSGEATSYELAKQFRAYIDKRYPQGKNGEKFIFGDKYSDLFLGYRACYDTDELVALMRLVKVSSQTLFPGKEKEMVPMMPRNCDNMRASDLYRWAGQLFGVRGLDSRINSYLYISGSVNYGDEYGKYGAIHDARGSGDMLELLHKLKDLYDEGLILQNFDDMTATDDPKGNFANNLLYSGGSDSKAGFMLYDYPKDLNDWNRFETSEKDPLKPCVWVTPQGKSKENGHPYNLRAVVGAIAHWQVDPTATGEAGYEWMPFTESWASIKTSALCLNAKLPQNPEKLAAAFKLIDYVYGDEGRFLYNFGPWEEGYITEKAGKAQLDDKYNPDPKVDYIEYQGKRYPRFTPNALDQNLTISGISRKFMGTTIPFGFIKLNAVNYQTMEEKTTRLGVDVINKAIAAGTFKHVLIGPETETQEEDYTKPFYQIVPSAFFLTKGQSSAISALLNKDKLGSMFTDSSSSNFNIWDALIMGKETRNAVTLDNYKDKMYEWGVRKLETYYQDAFEIMSPRLDDPEPEFIKR